LFIFYHGQKIAAIKDFKSGDLGISLERQSPGGNKGGGSYEMLEFRLKEEMAAEKKLQ